uniref:Putative secreted protein n=1 Tax=Anopheles darlingi TaxID=43151 RepID=A0A2M4DC96_ANODA
MRSRDGSFIMIFVFLKTNLLTAVDCDVSSIGYSCVVKLKHTSAIVISSLLRLPMQPLDATYSPFMERFNG